MTWHLKQCIHHTGFWLRRRKESCKEIIITTNHTLHCDQTSYSLQQRYCFDDSTKHVPLKSLSPSGISVSSYSIIISLHFDCAGHSLHKWLWSCLVTGSCDHRDYRNGWICHHVEPSLQRQFILLCPTLSHGCWIHKWKDKVEHTKSRLYICNESSAVLCGDVANLERQRDIIAKPNWESWKLISLQLVK